jgi:apolipoprotein N-acyltransferase
VGNILTAFVFGMILALAFPKAGFSWLAWISIAPLMYMIYRLRWRHVILCGLAFGMGFFAVLIYWIALFGKLPWIALAIFESLYITAFVVAAKAIGTRLAPWERLILIPSLWVAFEWLRSLGMLGFTWGDLGYSQYRTLPILQIASLGGIWGLSFLIALANASVSILIGAIRELRRPSVAVPYLAATAVLVAATIGFGCIALRPSDMHDKRIVAAVAQGNIKQNTDDLMDYANNSLNTYRTLTMEASHRHADIVVWPETVVPGALGADPLVRDQIERLARDAGSTLLVGGWDEDAKGRVYNSAFLISPLSGLVNSSSKIHLVPFGEFVPARKYLPFLKYYEVRSQDTSPGSGYHVMNAGEYEIGTAICFESTFPEIARRLTASGANILCVLTDDEWFGNSSAAEQHLSQSVLRAVENGRYVLRGAATGESCIIDPDGRILCKQNLWSPALLTADVAPRSEKTFYTRFGDWIVYMSIALSLLGIALSLYSRKRDSS